MQALSLDVSGARSNPTTQGPEDLFSKLLKGILVNETHHLPRPISSSAQPASSQYKSEEEASNSFSFSTLLPPRSPFLLSFSLSPLQLQLQ